MNNAILLIILFNYLRKVLETKMTNPRLHKMLLAGIIVCAGLLVLGTSWHPARPYIKWSAHAAMLVMIVIVLTQKQFQPAKLFVYALLPLSVIDFTSDILQKLAPIFYEEWGTYFDAAAIFSLVWLIAMMIINGRQRKALQKEKLKLLEKEKEAKLAEEMKVLLEVQVAERTAELLSQKQELEAALDDLKAAQLQLVQSEKMASLGELTAGIAHEIQNPLNFVNNFSEVNKELLAEMNDAITKGDYEEAKALAVDISGNQDKINFHGKRADGIVKGMLQHSRTSSGQKELTDINTLSDEYLRLSFHGLRAKDKTFNAKFETSFDNTIEKISIVPQDIGRVILNLINNAFYAVTEKRKQNITGYEPTVTISTKKMDEKIEIKVNDNGNGIPQKVLDKIFQPFFTTKPTGQGTGLGLSLSYDIVKAHGGELKVETKEGEGSTFIIHLPLT
jgi:two-component system, NtrC family, sensor kinase